MEELGGVDWEEHVGTPKPRQVKTHGEWREEQDRLAEQAKQDKENFEGYALFKLSDKYKYTPQQHDEITAAQARVKRVAEARPLPSSLKVLSDVWASGGTRATQFPNRANISLHNAKTGREYGSISWDPRTGYVNGQYMDKNYEQYVPHLLHAAREYADKTGMGMASPTHSDSLSEDSYREMRRHTPSFIPEDAHVEGWSLKDVGPEGLAKLHNLHSQISELHAVTMQGFNNHPDIHSEFLWNVNHGFTSALKHVSDAIKAHSTSRYKSISSHLGRAAGALQDTEITLNRNDVNWDGTRPETPHPSRGHSRRMGAEAYVIARGLETIAYPRISTKD
jgi:hypothetical protein